MPALDNLELLFTVTAFLFQIILIVHFALRRWRFDIVQRHGWIVYALGAPAAVIGFLLLRGGKPWWLWLGGFLYLVWAIFGYAVEYVRGIEWRNPTRWEILVPYVCLYLATSMFYWWPVGLLWRPLWYVQALLFVISTVLNAASHKGPPV
jgi:hypothetical protein